MTTSLAPERFGYLVPPTETDESNAYLYATMRARKQVCEQFPELYTWVPDSGVSFPCPAGLECVSGRCVFNEQGCRATSMPDVFDCKRRTVPCHIDSHQGQCEVCEYETHNEVNRKYVQTLPSIHPPCAVDDVSCRDCAPGDDVYYYFTNPEEDKAKDADPVTAATKCKRQFNPPAYLIDGEKVPCASDDDCIYDGAGGACMLYKNADAYGFCVDTGAGYLEYRRNFTTDGDGNSQGQCVLALNQLKTWCEMPWTRPGPPNSKDDSPAAGKLSLEDRILLHPQTRMHPPFYYDDRSGKCYMTKDYCKNSIEKGGYETAFGHARDYIVFNNCTYPHGHSNYIREGYDCCTPFKQSLGEFFLGRTLLTELKDVVAGRMSLTELLDTDAKAIMVYEFLSDSQLKTDVELLQRDYAAPGVHAYLFRWTPTARMLYPAATVTTRADGKRLGLLADEIAVLYPWAVQRDEHGYCTIRFSDAAYDADPVYKRIVNALYLMDVHARSDLTQ